MKATVVRALAMGAIGALAGAVSLVVAYASGPGIAIDTSRDLPPAVRGLYPPERDPAGLSFAWSRGRVDITLPGLDRRASWRFIARLRGARADVRTLPDIIVAIDGVAVYTERTTNEFRTLDVPIPPRTDSRQGVAISLSVSQTFTPGGGDTRQLGVVFDEIVIRPEQGLVIPPRSMLVAATLAGAILGAWLVLIGLMPATALGTTLLLAIGQSFPLARGFAPFSAYADRVPRLVLGLTAGTLAIVWLIERAAGDRLRQTARFVAVFSTGALYLQLLALLHPSKDLVDAVFHAHRLEWVLGGRYYFTQLMPNGVQFPYAIGLYLFAAPWSVFTRDYVTLLRIVVCVCYAIAGALLYPMVVRAWNDRLTGATAVALFHLVPLPYLVIGNANLTYAFGASAAFATIAAATVWRLRPRDVIQIAGLFLLSSLAFLSHVGIFPVLLTMLVGVALCYVAMGGPTLRGPAIGVFLAAVLAAVFAVVTYYGHFDEVYARLSRVRAPVSAPAGGAPEVGRDPAAAPDRGTTVTTSSLHVRAMNGAWRGVTAFGWPIVLFAFVGLWRLWTEGGRDRLRLGVVGGGLGYFAFLAVAVFAPVARLFQRYTDEFIDRVHYAAIPLAAILAARGFTWAWQAGGVARVGSIGAVLATAVIGVRQWAAWLMP